MHFSDWVVHEGCKVGHEGAPDDSRYYSIWKAETCEKEIKEFMFCPPEDGGWSDYEEEKECSEKCFRKSERTCTNPEPKYGGEECTGDSVKYEQCHDGQCNANGCYELNIRYHQNSIGSSIPASELDYSVPKCHEKCQETEECVGFTMSETNCFLKSRLENRAAYDNRISGPKDCPGKCKSVPYIDI